MVAAALRSARIHSGAGSDSNLAKAGRGGKLSAAGAHSATQSRPAMDDWYSRPSALGQVRRIATAQVRVCRLGPVLSSWDAPSRSADRSVTSINRSVLVGIQE